MFAMESPRSFFNPARPGPDAHAAYYDPASFSFPPNASANNNPAGHHHSHSPHSRSPHGSPDSFDEFEHRRQQQHHQFGAVQQQPQFVHAPAATLFQYAPQSAASANAHDQRSTSSASPGLTPQLGGGYSTTPSPPPQDMHGAPGQQQQKTFAFIALPGNQVRKRPRRRYDEIERLYACNWPNCTKSYGTLNHLNAHVTMQRHGEKRSPNEFKEMRKQWRKQKKEEAAIQAMHQASYATPPRGDHSHHLHHPHSPMSLGFATPSEFSPIDGAGDHMLSASGSVVPRRMSLPNLGLTPLGLDAMPPFPPAGIHLPSLTLHHQHQQQQEYWMPGAHGGNPHSAPPHPASFLPEPLHMPAQRLPHDSTLLTPLQHHRSDD